MLAAKRSRPDTQAGQALVELAFVGMVLATLLLAIYEIVSMYNAYNAVEEATRAGVRVITLNYSDNNSIDRVVQILDGHGLNTVTGSHCNVSEIDIYEAAGRNNQAVAAPVPMQQFKLQPGTDTYGGACTTQPSSYYPPFDQTTRNVLAVASQGQQPATVGVRVIYTYHFHTPLLAAFGRTYTFSPSSIFPMGGDNANNFQNEPVNAPPVPPAQPNPPVSMSLSPANAFPVGATVISPTITITPTGTITTTGVITGTGTITGTGVMGHYTYTYSPASTLWSSQPFSGTGVLTATGTTPISETFYDSYAYGAVQPTLGYTITWTPGATGVATPTGFLVYMVHNGVPNLVPGVTAANPVPYVSPTYTYTYPYAGLNAVYQPYQPSLVPGDAFYVTAVNNGIESSIPAQSTWAQANLAAAPVRPPPTFTAPPANFQVTLPYCLSGSYVPELGVRLSWDPVANASGYIVSYVHYTGLTPPYTTTNLAGSGSSNPWSSTQYPSTGSTYAPQYFARDYWTVAAVVNGVVSQFPAQSPAVTALQACAPENTGS